MALAVHEGFAKKIGRVLRAKEGELFLTVAVHFGPTNEGYE
jgi:hypothetical protein